MNRDDHYITAAGFQWQHCGASTLDGAKRAAMREFSGSGFNGESIKVGIARDATSIETVAERSNMPGSHWRDLD